MNGYTKNGYTKVDNWLWDSVMPKARPNTFKVVAAVVRMSAGWRRESARITFDEFQAMTGMPRATLAAAIKDALSQGFIERQELDNSFYYSSKTELDSSEIELSDSSKTELDSSEIELSDSSKTELDSSEIELPVVQKLNYEQFNFRTVDSSEIELPSIREKKIKEKERKGETRAPKPHEIEAWNLVLEMCDGNEADALRVFRFESELYARAGWLRPGTRTSLQREDALRDCWRPARLILGMAAGDVAAAVTLAVGALGRMRADGLTPARASALLGELSRARASPAMVGGGHELAEMELVDGAY